MSAANLPSKIQFIPPSEWAVCLHEAGHAAAALVNRQLPALMEIFDGPPPYGRNRIPVVSGAPRRLIAVGGYAVELALFHGGRLVDADNTPLSQKAFIAQAVGQNAAQDKVAFFEEDRSDANGEWSAHDDLKFMRLADQLQPLFPMDHVRALAAALMQERLLTSERILEIWNDV